MRLCLDWQWQIAEPLYDRLPNRLLLKESPVRRAEGEYTL